MSPTILLRVCLMKPIRHEIIPPEERFLHSPEDCATLKKGCQFIREIGNRIGL